ncbi:glucuronate isomerase [Rubripirellula amarantea]|uniref:Glucuronate isomerase n=1 Tax=Rubripirellula amarantea TaxID=2527999 RepID=A0A5C5WQI1_9BACT|nr:glucuronate isomerase [Rubripirellula amarantea]TWT53154.1 glucuronate isomerase [Rubripirellula amarantea]
MTHSTRDSIYDAIASIRLIDPHTHINPHNPASSTLADLLGYHYYTELAHSAGMPKNQIEEPGISPRELVHRLVKNLGPLENTAQYRWLVEICRMFFGFEGHRIDESNWEDLFDRSESIMASADWPQSVLDQSNVEAVFLTNEFDDPLSGFDTDTYIPCLRTDDLVFHLAKTSVRDRLAVASGIELSDDLGTLRQSLHQRFEHFVANGARACAISLPPNFCPLPVSDGRASSALSHVLQNGELADASHKAALARRVFWTLAELCDEFELPFDLMIGVNRGVYPGGVYQGQDLYDSRVSLTQYRELFNAFPNVKFPISVLASVTNQELVSHAWIFPNVITNGHWWYSNTPSFITRDAQARLEAVPQTKQIGYYSDAYKLEFVWPKFDMYRRCLSGILHDHFVVQCGWSEEAAIELGRRILRDNVDEIFPKPNRTLLEDTIHLDAPDAEEIADAPATLADIAGIGATASLAAGAIGMVEVDAEPADDDVDSFATIEETSVDSGNEETIAMSTAELDSADLDFDRAVSGTPEPAATDSEATASELTSPIDDETDDTIDIEEVNNDLEIDPVPTLDEVESLGVADVELADDATEAKNLDAESIESMVNDESLDLGDMTSESEPETEPDNTSGESNMDYPGNIETVDLSDLNEPTDEPSIQFLRNEKSFAPDEESLRLKPDPLTGELTFPTSDEDNSLDDDDMLLHDDDLEVQSDLVTEASSLDLEIDDDPIIELTGDEDDDDLVIDFLDPENEKDA